MAIRKENSGRQIRWTKRATGLALAGLAGLSSSANAGSFGFLGIDGTWSLQGAYAIAVRTEKPSDGIINSPPAASIPLPTYLKVPESNNYDDGDRSFKQWTPVNNRVSALGEIHLTKDEYDLVVRGDAFYDNVYRRANDNNSPDTINKFGPDGKTTEGADYNHFTKDARKFDGMRGRLLDAYISANWQLGDESALNIRAGRHIAAWGESLFFNGIALTQSPADATKATVPGADVKSILLPVNQISMQFSATSKLSFLGQYKLEYKPTELNPVGEFFSVADVVGPGRQMIYGIYNPLYLPAYSNLCLTCSSQPSGQNDVAAAVQLINGFIIQNGSIPGYDQLAKPLQVAVDAATAQINALGLPKVLLPSQVLQAIISPTGAQKYINPYYDGEIRPSNYGQYSVGMKYAFTPSTTGGIYYLRYHDTTPSPVQYYSTSTPGESPVLLPGPTPQTTITVNTLGITVPYKYKIKYFDGIKMLATSLSTELFGANIGAEAIYRDGVPVLVNVDGGITGPIPTPSRSRIGQFDINALYIFGNTQWYDSITLVADVGGNKVFSVDPVNSVAKPSNPPTTELKYDYSTWGYSFLWFIDRKNVFDGWDLQIPMTFAGIVRGHGSFLSGMGALMGPGDRRASVGVNFTRLQALQLGLTYSAYLGSPNFTDRPYQDRDNLGLTVKYSF